MPIVFDPKVDPIYKRGVKQGVKQGIKKAKLEAAKTFIKEFNAPIEMVSKKLNIPLKELRKYLNQK